MPERNCKECEAKTKRRWGCFAKQHWQVDQETGEPLFTKDGKPKLFWTDRAYMPLRIDGEDVYACPRQHVRENPMLWHYLLLYYGLYQKGHLPEDGPASRQSHFAMSVFALMDDYNRQADDELDERRRQNDNAKPPPG